MRDQESKSVYLTYAGVSSIVPDTVYNIEDSATGVPLPTLHPVAEGDRVAILVAGADLLVLGPVLGTADFTDFTPSWNNVTLGTGNTNEGRYIRVSGGLYLQAYVQFGTSPSISGSVTFDIPDGYVERGGSFRGHGGVLLRDGTVDYQGNVWTGPNHDVVALYYGTDNVTASNPFTVASGDEWWVSIMFPL